MNYFNVLGRMGVKCKCEGDQTVYENIEFIDDPVSKADIESESQKEQQRQTMRDQRRDRIKTKKQGQKTIQELNALVDDLIDQLKEDNVI